MPAPDRHAGLSVHGRRSQLLRSVPARLLITAPRGRRTIGSSKPAERTSPTWAKSTATGCCAYAAKAAKWSWSRYHRRSAGPSTARQAHAPANPSYILAAYMASGT